MGIADSKFLDAVTSGDVNTVRELVEGGANWRGKDKVGRGALHYAAEKGRLEVCQYLCDIGASMTSTDYSGYNPLLTAANYNHFDVVKFFLDKGMKVDDDAQTGGKNCLYFAASHNDMAMVKYLVEERGATVYKKSGPTALHEAARLGNLEMMNYLLDHGANVNAKEKRGTTPLVYAVFTSKMEVVECLVEHGADPNIDSGAYGGSPMDLARKKDLSDMVDYLASHGGK